MKKKTTMEDVTATFNEIEDRVGSTMLCMNRDELAQVIQGIVKVARSHAEFAVRFPASAEEKFADCRAILGAIRETMCINTSIG